VRLGVSLDGNRLADSKAAAVRSCHILLVEQTVRCWLLVALVGSLAPSSTPHDSLPLSLTALHDGALKAGPLSPKLSKVTDITTGPVRAAHTKRTIVWRGCLSTTCLT